MTGEGGQLETDPSASSDEIAGIAGGPEPCVETGKLKPSSESDPTGEASFWRNSAGPRKGSIVKRILWLLVFWGMIIYLLSVFGIWWGSSNVIEDSFENQAFEWVRKLDELGTPLYASDDQRLFKSIQDHVARFPELAYLRYYKLEDNAVIAEYTSDQFPDLAIPYLSNEHFADLKQNAKSDELIVVNTFEDGLSLMQASAPIVIRSIESDGLMEFNLENAEAAEKYKVIGFVELGLDFGAYRKQLLHNILLGSLLMAVILLIVTFIGRGLIKRSLSPLTELREPLKRLADGDTDVHVQGAGDQEIDAIANALNATIAALKDRDEKLRRLADCDALTGLLNKKSFNQLLEKELKRVTDEDDNSALIFIDLDKFKYINDNLGHVAGDRLLTQVADLLLKHTRESDVLARFGGDEFSVIVKSVSEGEAESIAQAIVNGMREFVFVENEKPFKIYCSVGVALINPGETSIEDVFIKADLACFDAKSNGRNCYHIYDDGTLTQSSRGEEISWSKTLGEALDKDLFLLRFQPIVGLTDSTCEFYEVQLQLKLHNEEFLDSSVFLPAADRLGLSEDIGDWLIRNTFDKLESVIAEARTIKLIINLSSLYFEMPALVESIVSALQACPIDSSCIVFQVTEQTAIKQIERTRQHMSALAEIGFQFSLSELGSDNRSFAYLKGLPLDYMKVDCSCFSSEKTDPIDRLTLGYLIKIAKVLGKSVIGESVLNARTLEAVREHGIDFAQGSHIGKPRTTIPAKSYERLVDKYSRVA